MQTIDGHILRKWISSLAKSMLSIRFNVIWILCMRFLGFVALFYLLKKKNFQENPSFWHLLQVIPEFWIIVELDSLHFKPDIKYDAFEIFPNEFIVTLNHIKIQSKDMALKSATHWTKYFFLQKYNLAKDTENTESHNIIENCKKTFF